MQKRVELTCSVFWGEVPTGFFYTIEACYVKSLKIEVLRVTLSVGFIDVNFNLAISFTNILNNLMIDPACMKYYFLMFLGGFLHFFLMCNG
jgi:hypothetical protein